MLCGCYLSTGKLECHIFHLLLVHDVASNMAVTWHAMWVMMKLADVACMMLTWQFVGATSTVFLEFRDIFGDINVDV